MNDNRPVNRYRPTAYAREVTRTEREMAQLVVDTDDGESPFGWRENDAGLPDSAENDTTCRT